MLKIINLYSLIEQAPYDLFTAYDNFQANKDENYKNLLPIADNGYGDEVCIGLKGENRGEIYICAGKKMKLFYPILFWFSSMLIFS